MRPFRLQGHEKPLKEVKFNYDGDLLFTGAAENTINVW
jgi:translation initiation factor 3 subunit I